MIEYEVIVTWPDGADENVVLMASDFACAYAEAMGIFEGATINGICEARWLMRERTEVDTGECK